MNLTMKTITFLLLIYINVLAVDKIQAQNELKIGYVDPQTILARMPEMAAVDRKLQNFAEKKREEFNTKQQAFLEQVQSYEQKASVISEEAKKKEEQRLEGLRQELMQFETTYQQELQQKQSEMVGPLLQQIQGAINEVAQEENLTYVFNTVTSSGDFILLYASENAQKKYNITEKVMAKLNI